MHKIICFKTFLRFGATALMSGTMACGYAQTSVPDETSRPVLSPGRVGAQGAQGTKPITSPVMETSVADIMKNPARHANRNVSVSSIVGQVHSPWSFQLDERSLTSGGVDNDLLVIAAEPLATMGFKPEWRNRKIVATGTVRIVQAADFRRDYGRGVDDELFRRFEGKPALVASSLRLAE